MSIKIYLMNICRSLMLPSAVSSFFWAKYTTQKQVWYSKALNISNLVAKNETSIFNFSVIIKRNYY